MSIKKWLIIAVTSLLAVVVVSITFAFYYQFQEALNERVLLQLTSIKRLKRIQIEAYLNREFQEFQDSNEDFSLETRRDIISELNNNSIYDKSGAYDISYLNPEGKLSILFIQKNDTVKRIKIVNDIRIQEILLERTGMGESGETYLVGNDYRLRSMSRFFPEDPPLDIIAKTKGVKSVFSGRNGSGIIKDYRGVVVYSAFRRINFSNIDWAILSEIDKKEVMIPLNKVQEKLVLIAVFIIIIGWMIALYLARFFSKPFLEMESRLQAMTNGDYSKKITESNKLREVNNMFSALNELQHSLQGALEFSHKIGEMDLKSSYSPASSTDLLGESLVRMRDKLIEFRSKESNYNSFMKKSLIEREEQERKRISMELHDGIGPLLTTLKLYVQKNISDDVVKNEIKEILDNTISETRNITYTLMPPTLVDFGIGHTLKGFVESLQKTKDINIRFEDDTLNERTNMSYDLQINLFRICQELLNNTIKHASATKIVLTLTEMETYVSLYYFDNGIGYDTEEIFQGSGLTNIKERVDIFNGQITVSSEKHNTITEIEIPIHYEAN